MEDINRNRLLGVAVLALTAFFFVPSIIDAPAGKKDSNSEISISFDLSDYNKNDILKKQTLMLENKKYFSNNTRENNDKKFTYLLESDKNVNQLDSAPKMVVTSAVANKNKSKNIENNKSRVDNASKIKSNNNNAPAISVKLESIKSISTIKNKKKISSKSTGKTINTENTDYEGWIRVGSFSNLKNANNLVSSLKNKKYPVKTEDIKVLGEVYRRVLVGPFKSKKKIRAILNNIRLDGFSPSVQH